MNELSLFSGAGGGLLGTKLLGFRHVGYVEWEPYCQAVIAQRIKDGYLDEAPIFGDVREFVQSGAARQYRGFADVVSAGFPCQPFSVAGKQAAADDPRNMWPATRDVIRDVQPNIAWLENVTGLLGTGYCGTIFADLAALGFDARWGVFSAEGVGAPHLRERLFILAYSAQELGDVRADYGKSDCAASLSQSGDGDWSRFPANAGEERAEGIKPQAFSWQSAFPWGKVLRRIEDLRERSDLPQPLIRRVDDGVAHYVDRVGAAGNGQVPAVVVRAWQELTTPL